MCKISKLAAVAAVALTLGMTAAMAGGSMKDDHDDHCSAKRWAGFYAGVNPAFRQATNKQRNEILRNYEPLHAACESDKPICRPTD